MKPRITILAALLVGIALPLPLLADNPPVGKVTEARGDVQPLSEGTVKKVDAAGGRITIAHGPLDNLNMPAMTMTFEVKDKGSLKGLKKGDKVRFRAEQVGDKLVATRLRRAR